MEASGNRISLSRDRQVRILERLTDAVIFEEFLQKKFIGAKSFSLEGAESLIPLLDMAIEEAGDRGIKEMVFGMPHRGRLNVLANIMGKSPRRIFGEFRDRDAERFIGRGDVKYHMGFTGEWETSSGARVDLELMFNPSHLEFVSPVAQGAVKAGLDERHGERTDTGLLVLMHGDAAFAGEGIVQETFNLSGIDGYSVGGALHIVVNNQIGFTTLSSEGRTSTYASDIAKMLQVPIFHVNGENPEAVAQALQLALDFRMRFKRDAVIDMYCYRRRGHNESDEPTFTQPLMYERIRKMPNVLESYTAHLLGLGELRREDAEVIKRERLKLLERHFDDLSEPTELPGPAADTGAVPRPDIGPDELPTGVDEETLGALLRGISDVPQGFNAHKKITKLLAERLRMAEGERPLDWGAAEALAFATLALEGRRVRLSGQDSQRGTFSHRHAVLHDFVNGSNIMPLATLRPDQARVEIINSPLSEGSVLGFEYGYSIASPDALVMWEAQFGDFANAAQVYIDQFIAGGEVKWQVPSSLVLLLPHGLEGTGPEHASARLERFLSMAALDNYRVVSPTTPAQIFHLLRRQALSQVKKPLVVMSPKSMLRHREAVSPLADLAAGSFRHIIEDDRPAGTPTTRVILCNGKIYYDLIARRRELGRDDTAIIRIEQLYPLKGEQLDAALAPYPAGIPVVWTQEEPLNMGAAGFIQLHYARAVERRHPFFRTGRPESASPATGSAASHRLEQERVLERAFGDTAVLEQ